MCSGECVFFPSSSSLFLLLLFFFFLTFPSVDFALLFGGRGLMQLCYPVQLLFSLCAAFVILWFVSFLFLFVLGFVASFLLLLY
jgi:hypothetical protein